MYLIQYDGQHCDETSKLLAAREVFIDFVKLILYSSMLAIVCGLFSKFVIVGLTIVASIRAVRRHTARLVHIYSSRSQCFTC